MRAIIVVYSRCSRLGYGTNSTLDRKEEPRSGGFVNGMMRSQEVSRFQSLEGCENREESSSKPTHGKSS